MQNIWNPSPMPPDPTGARHGSPLPPDPPVAEYLQSPRNVKEVRALDQARGNGGSADPGR
jgi:hypothetical protein